MGSPDRLESVLSLLGAPSPAVLTLHRPDGSALVSPVWFRRNGDALEVVIAVTDGKVNHLRRDPRCVLVVFETVPPFRGLEIRADALLSPDGVADARLAIASRYLGPDAGRRFAATRGDRGFVLRLPLEGARTWDLRSILPA
jgi:PPOX class probable F420-dependent enzyme